jgi:hypothetical protein
VLASLYLGRGGRNRAAQAACRHDARRARLPRPQPLRGLPLSEKAHMRPILTQR